MVSRLISRLIAAIARWFSPRTPDEPAPDTSGGARRLDYDAYIRDNVGDLDS